jgi:hypothetical protein
MKKILLLATGFFTLYAPGFNVLHAWDYEGHRVVNQLALAALPTNFPAFVRAPAAQERIAFLGGEPDRWRNTPDELPLSQLNGPDHYIDLEELDAIGLTPQTLPIFRYDFAAKLALARAAHPEKFPLIDETRNRDHTRELVGFLPWAIVEYCGKLKSGFSYLKAYEQNGGTPGEIANAQANIIYVMGVMGHFVGDAAQPLHTTIHHHGWVGDNPHGYTTTTSIHSWIDGGYFLKTGGLKLETMNGKIHQAQTVGNPAQPDDLFNQVMAYIVAQHKQLEPLYQLNKDGKLSGEGEAGLEGRVFLEGQLVRGGQMLGNLWYSAWQQAPEDRYLKSSLAARKVAAEKKALGAEKK